MTLRTRFLASIALSLGVALAGLAWWQAPNLARRMVFYRAGGDAGTTLLAPAIPAVQQQVQAARATLGLPSGAVVAAATEPRSDAAGGWEVLQQRWVLPSGLAAPDLGQRLRSLVLAQEPAVEAYVVLREADEAQARFYCGPRLAAVVELVPTLDPWPVLAPDVHPRIALVLDNVDADPFAARTLMDRGLPLTLALSPYSPFTLRLARDALTTHSEVIARAVPDATLSEALDGVPTASGVLIACPLPGDPDAEARALAAASVYALDATEEGLETRWANALRDAGVPILRALRADPLAVEASERRLLHHAARQGGAALTVDVGSGIAAGALDAVGEAGARGYRVAFTAEVVAATGS